MGAKQSKGGKVKQNGTETAGEEGLGTFDKTSTLPATFKAKDEEMTKCGTLPREGVALDRNTSFSKRFRKSVSKLVGHKGKQEGCTDSPKTEDNLENKDEKNADRNGTKDEKDSTVKSPIDPKLAQKIARAKFFQDLYSTPTNVPKPPRSRNGFSPQQENGLSEDDVDRANNTTPVVKLIEKHQDAIEKHQEEIRSSMGSPDILKGRMDSFRKSKLVETNEAYAVEKESTMIEETKQEVRQEESSFKKVENISQSISEQKHSVTEVSSQMSSQVSTEVSSQVSTEVSSQVSSQVASQVTEQSQVSESQASVVIKEESTSVLKQEESHAMKEEITIKSESNLVQESSSTLMETVSEEKKQETLESMQVTEEFSSVQVSRQEESEFHIETKSTSEIISQSSENKESVGEILDTASDEKKSGEDNDITEDSEDDAEHDANEKEE